MQLEIKGISKYWLFQLMGWSLFIGINIFFAITYNLNDSQFLTRLALYVGVGLMFSHLMRLSIKQIDLLEKPINYQLIGFVVISILFGITIGIIETYLSVWLNLEYTEEKVLQISQKISSNIFTSFTYLFIWNCIYFIYHYIEQSRKTQLDKFKLEALVKTLELKTIKSHINPHFIFNALNSIRALIDENPLRARESVTALGNMLRSSLLSDQQETISLEQELNIVRDYLNLELIRFEDRLDVEYQIEDEVLDEQVPHMMLQTLVENAIKHGISRSIEPGKISISASEHDNAILLKVSNTGILNSSPLSEGFGLASTSNRLQLLYGNRATFSIKQIDPNWVEAQIQIQKENN